MDQYIAGLRFLGEMLGVLLKTLKGVKREEEISP